MSQVSNEVHFRLQIVSTSQGKLMILACFIGQTGAIKKLHNSLMFFLLIFIRKFLILLDSFITRDDSGQKKKLLSKAMCTVTWVSLIRPSIKVCLFKGVQVTVPCMLSKLKVLLYKISKTIVTLPLRSKPLLQDYNSCLLIKTLALFDISGSI